MIHHDATCDCPCHEGGHVWHIVPCCAECPHCRERIAGGDWTYERHVTECKTERERIADLVRTKP